MSEQSRKPGTTIKKTSKTLEIGTKTSQAPGLPALPPPSRIILLIFASAVTHETIKPVVYEVQQEVIDREIHTYDHVHRIQPIHDVEVLPALHYVKDEHGNLVEVSEDEIRRLEERGELAGERKQS